LGVKHACHLRIGGTALGVRQIALVRLGFAWLILVRKIARGWLVAHEPVLVVEKYR
jgi:hypothetical protein